MSILSPPPITMILVKVMLISCHNLGTLPAKIVPKSRQPSTILLSVSRAFTNSVVNHITQKSAKSQIKLARGNFISLPYSLHLPFILLYWEYCSILAILASLFLLCYYRIMNNEQNKKSNTFPAIIVIYYCKVTEGSVGNEAFPTAIIIFS